jgi:hypothetical protein
VSLLYVIPRRSRGISAVLRSAQGHRVGPKVNGHVVPVTQAGEVLRVASLPQDDGNTRGLRGAPSAFRASHSALRREALCPRPPLLSWILPLPDLASAVPLYAISCILHSGVAVPDRAPYPVVIFRILSTSTLYFAGSSTFTIFLFSVACGSARSTTSGVGRRFL